MGDADGRGTGVSETAPAAAPPAPAARLRPDRADQEFLPAALSILERPASPIATALMLSICALAALVLAWAWLGWTDIVAVASGKVQPSGRVRTVQPLETGRVRAILATNGVRVARGDVLVELDAEEAFEDVRALSAAFDSAQAEILRRDAAIAIAAAAAFSVEGAPPIAWPAALSDAIRRREEAVLRADLDHLSGQWRSLKAQRAQKRAERARLADTIERQEALVATLQERVDMRTTLLRTDAGTKSGVIDAMESLNYQRMVIAGQKGQLVEAERAIETLTAEIDKAGKAFLAENATKRADALRQLDDLGPRLAKARLRVERMTLRSPAAGTVQASAVTSLGQVLTVGQEAMRVVPEQEGLEIEVYLQNKDVGFVQVGQEATIKIEAFPFTRYGTLDATVVRIASDAIPEPDTRQADADPTRAGESRTVGAGQRVQNLVFPVILRAKQHAIVANGQPVPLSPGMAVTAEIKTGHRRLVDYVLAPLLETTSTAGRER